MTIRVFRLSVLFYIFLSLACGSQRTLEVQRPPGPSADSRSSTVTEEIAPAGDGINNSEVITATEDKTVAEEDVRTTAGPDETIAGVAAAENTESTQGFSMAGETAVDEAAVAVEEAVVETGTESKESDQNLLDAALDFVNSSQEYWSEGNPDKALAILDDAYELVLKVDTDQTPELFQQKEDLRFMISKRILEIYASRYTATNGKYDEIPLTLNQNVEKEIKRFQGREKRFFIESYQRSGKYMPIILAALKEAGLPEELAWVPLIESGFKVNALSSARALGLWQFIASTGQKFGLKRDTWVDERLDFEKSTAAAIAYLKELHQIFGDWTTVLAGYNCGEGRVLQKIRSQKINYLDNFWDLYQMLPNETAHYVPRFLATLHILKDPARYGFELGEPDTPVAFETITIKKQVQLKAVAKAIGAKEAELSALNPELRHKATPSTTYTLRVPEGITDLLLAKIDEIPKYTPPENTYVNHTVRNGETLSDIAVRYRTTVSRIVQANNIRSRNFIRVGQRLKVPLSGATVSSVQSASAAVKLLTGDKYQVRKGDTLWVIARRFNTNTVKIQQVNGLKNTILQIGQMLVIPQ